MHHPFVLQVWWFRGAGCHAVQPEEPTLTTTTAIPSTALILITVLILGTTDAATDSRVACISPVEPQAQPLRLPTQSMLRVRIMFASRACKSMQCVWKTLALVEPAHHSAHPRRIMYICMHAPFMLLLTRDFYAAINPTHPRYVNHHHARAPRLLRLLR